MCRWREESPFGKRVVTVPDATVLDWFRRGWNHDDPEAWIASELGGDVYGLESIFEEARKRDLPRPETVDALRELLHAHLWVEANDKGAFIRLGEHALRVRTDDDEVDLAYYFVDDVAAAASPDRLAFLLHDTWPLPCSTAAEDAVFDHGVPVRTVRLAPPGPPAVFSVRLCWDSPDTNRNLDLAGAIVFPGLTLPDLATQLRGTKTPTSTAGRMTPGCCGLLSPSGGRHRRSAMWISVSPGQSQNRPLAGDAFSSRSRSSAMNSSSLDPNR